MGSMWDKLSHIIIYCFLYLMENPKQGKKQVRLAQEMGYYHELVYQERKLGGYRMARSASK